MKKGRLPRKKKKELKKRYKIIFGERVHLKILTVTLSCKEVEQRHREAEEMARDKIFNAFGVPRFYFDEINHLDHLRNETRRE